MASLAQRSATFQFSREDGLPSNTIYDVYQAKNGFIWVATQNGIARFNGYSFKEYSFTNAKSRAVSDLTEDAYGRIWFKSFFGDIFYIENDSLKLFEPWNELNHKGFPTITFLSDTLSIISGDGLYLYSLKEKRFISKIKGKQYFDPEGWGVFFKNNKRTIINLFKKNKAYISPKNIPGLFKAKVFSRTWFFGSEERKLYKVTSEHTLEDISSDYLKQLQSCRDIKELKKNLISFIGIDGIYLTDLETGETIHLLAGENVSSMTAIQEGGYIISTLNNGLIYLPSVDSKILNGQHLKINFNRQDSSIIVGDFNGNVSILNRQLQLIKSIPAQFKREVQSLLVNTEEQEILYYTNSLYNYSISKETLVKQHGIGSSKQIIAAQGKYLFATSAGFQVLLKNNEIDYYLRGIRCTSLAYDSINSEVWIGSQLGLHHFKLNGDKPPQAFKIKGFSEEFGVSCLAIQDRNLLVGTPSKGLIIVNLNSKEFEQHINKSHGLASSDITSLKVNKDEKLIGTDKGLSIINNKNIVQNLNKTKGLIAEEIYDLVLEDNYFWVIHDKGIQKIRKSIEKNFQKPKLIIDKIIIDGQKIDTDSSDKTIELKPEQHQLNVKFDIGNNIKSLGDATIKYRIKELNTKNWNITTLKNPSANYLGLSPGDYHLEAYALNEDGVASDRIKLFIKVNAPFYKKAWFIILITILGCFVLGLLLYLRSQSKYRKQQTSLLLKSNEQALQLAQLTSIRSQMNPHFIFNTMSLIQGKILNGLPNLAEKIIQDFSLLMRKILEFSQVETVSLAAELEVINRYLSIESERSQGILNYEIILAPGLDADMYNIPSLVTQPFVENSIKHGLMHKKGEKKIVINCQANEKELIICIEDNGIGRKASQLIQQKRVKKHKSFAIESYKKRFELFNSLRQEKVHFSIEDLYNERDKPIGTAVIITISYEDYENE